MLSKITAQNFLSWKELVFDVTKGATLIDGWNEDDQRSEGSGKSAVLNAISWCIFGKLPKDANVDDVIKDGESSCVVVLDFDNGDSIVRSRKPNELFISKGGITVKGKDARETQTFIEEYVGCNFETFCQSVYFAQNYDKKFLSANQEEKGKILSSIQNLQIFDKARKETMDLLKLENEKIVTLKNQVTVQENNLNNYKSQQALVESFIKDKTEKHNAQVRMMTQQRDLLAGHLKRTLSDIEIVNQKVLAIDLNQLSSDETELNQAKTQVNTDLSAVIYQKSQIDTVKKAIAAKELEGKNLAAKYGTFENKLKVSLNSKSPSYLRLELQRTNLLDLTKNQSRTRLLTKAKQLEDFIANPTKICPSCGTGLASTDTSHTQKELESILKEVSDLQVSIDTQIIELDKQMANDLEIVKTEQISMEEEMKQILVQLEAVSEFLDQNQVPSVDDLIAQETQLKSTIKQIDEALFQTQQKKNEHSALLNQHSSLMGQQSSYFDQHASYEKSIRELGQPDVSQDMAKLGAIQLELDTTLIKLSEVKNLVNVSEAHAQRLETLKDGFKEIKSYVFTNALNELNFRTNQYLNDLFEMEAAIKFTNEDQKIESKISINGQTRSLGLLSGGQNRRFNLAVDLALADIVSYRKTSKLDLLIFDEYFKDLSEISMEKSLDLLKSRKCPVILIEHNSIFKNIVDNTFFVRLENGTSRESRQ